MNPDPRNRMHLTAQPGKPDTKRPLIGVPTGREKSQRFFGLPLYIMNQTYIRVLENLGALPVMIPLQMSEETLFGIFQRLDGLFLPGGEDLDPSAYGQERHPQLGAPDKERDRTELLLTRWALAEGMPLLGVCRGIQVMNVHLGGSLHQDLGAERTGLAHQQKAPWSARVHDITVDPGSKLCAIVGTALRANSFHHQAIKQVAPSLTVTARAEVGLVEAVDGTREEHAAGGVGRKPARAAHRRRPTRVHDQSPAAIDPHTSHGFVGARYETLEAPHVVEGVRRLPESERREEQCRFLMGQRVAHIAREERREPGVLFLENHRPHVEESLGSGAFP